jgi:Family of unknown function (DUF6526)
MPEKPQSKENHTKVDPAFHYVLMPALALLLVWTAVRLIRNPGATTATLLILVILMILMAFRFRPYALKVQDRVIRLEERLRLSLLLPENLRPRIPELTERQLIALRFASDAELPALVERALRENLAPKQIKDAIQTWRPDYWRV